MPGLNVTDLVVRGVEELFFHPTGLYFFLDKTFGISKVDPMETLGIYNDMKQKLGVMSVPLTTQQMNVPSALPPPPALASGGQVAIVQVPYRPKRPTPTFG